MNDACATFQQPSEPAGGKTMMPDEVRRLARVFEHSAAGIALLDLEGRWLDINPAFCQLVGYSREELLGASFVDITHSEDVERSVVQLDRLKRGEISSFRFDKRYRHATGREIWVRLDVSLLRDDQARPELIVTQAHDISASLEIRHQLEANEARLSSIIRSMAEGVMVIDPDRSFSLANSRAADILGVEHESLRRLSLDDFSLNCIHADGSDFAIGEFPALVTLESGEPQREVVMGVERPDGTMAWIEISAEPVRGEAPEQVGWVVATFSDISARVRTEEALKESEERLSLALEGAHLGMWDWHLDTREFTFNRIAALMLGYRQSDVAASVEAVRALAHPDDQQRLADAMQKHLKGFTPQFDIDVRMQRKSGGYAWTNMRGRITERDANDRPVRVTGMMIDISQRKELEDRLKVLATRDELTGLLNRRAGTERLDHELERARREGRPFALILLDIDHFKSVNDRFGHDEGDRVLAAVAGMVRERKRKIDAAARWGGEEFAIILPGSDRDGGRKFAEELLENMALIRMPDGSGLTASFGVVDWCREDTASELVKRADRLMYKAKNAGRARVEVE
ncbi:MAG: PAS domain S-box protein, partial [Wenzhouxiangellaceae bacterium]